MLNSGFSTLFMSVVRAMPLILRFFLLALVMAAAVHFVFASDALRIGVFFTFVLTLSLFFPSTCGTVDKEAVDLIYYGTAMLPPGSFLPRKSNGSTSNSLHRSTCLANSNMKSKPRYPALITSLATLRSF